MRVLENRRFLTGFATLALFTGLAADAWRNSISWYGYGAVIAVIVAVSVMILIRHRRFVTISRLPWPLLTLLALMLASIAWSAYPLESAIGVFAQLITTAGALAVALVLTRDELLRALGRALRVILALSIVFELVVSLIVRAPVLPVWVTEADRVDPPKLLYWSRNLLLEGDKIQGIVGSSSLLAMVALLAVIVFSIQVAARTVRPLAGSLWIAFALLMVALTRSATIYLGLIAAVVVLAMILLMRRARTTSARRITLTAIVVGALALIAAVIALRGPILAVFGKNSELTGRVGIWDAVIGLAVQRPVFGWGWVSFWPPWVEPFRDLVKRAGVQQLHAHDAWLDVWLQVGLVGLVVFALFVATTGIRSWFLATDRGVVIDREGHDDAPSASPTGDFSTQSLLAPLLLTALIVQSLAESRILIEGGWMLLVILAVTTKVGMLGRVQSSAEVQSADRAQSTRRAQPGGQPQSADRARPPSRGARTSTGSDR